MSGPPGSPRPPRVAWRRWDLTDTAVLLGAAALVVLSFHPWWRHVVLRRDERQQWTELPIDLTAWRSAAASAAVLVAVTAAVLWTLLPTVGRPVAVVLGLLAPVLVAVQWHGWAHPPTGQGVLVQLTSAPVLELHAGRRTAGTAAFAVLVALELVMVVSLARRGRSRRARGADR